MFLTSNSIKNEVRWRRKFCLFPKYLSNHNLVWLRWIWVKEKQLFDRGSWGGVVWIELCSQIENPYKNNK